MRKRVIFIQYFTLLLLGVLIDVGGYFGWKEYLYPAIKQWRATIQEGNFLELFSSMASFIDQLMQWEQSSGSIKFMQWELKIEWILMAVPIVSAFLLSTFLAFMILVFVRKKEKLLTASESPKAPKTAAKPREKTNDAVELLTCLQKDGRFIDFLLEDISGYDDAQVGAAVRSIHENTRKALVKMVSLEPVRDESEDESVRIEAGFDPSAIRLTGHLKGDPPFTGILCHRGWKVTNINIENRPTTHDPFIIEPAEVEVT